MEAAGGPDSLAGDPLTVSGEMRVARRRRRPAGLIQRSGWWVRVWWYRLRASARTFRFWWHNAVFFLVWCSIGWPIFERNSTAHSAIYILLLVLMKLGLVRRVANSSNMQIVQRGYLERKTLLYRLVLEAGRHEAMTPQEIVRYQKDVLQLIASYVRCHREDAQGTEIFANLLAEDGDDLVVIARDREHRRPNARYPKKGMIVADAIAEGRAIFTGDVAKEYGVTGDRPYKSILVLPIQGQTAILGAVSVDSTRVHHFDIECDELERYLAPYVGLLVWTLENRARNSGLVTAEGSSS